ncbi:hypothetical protein T4B_14675 [Trichinella pseudospiralis]|uniref:Uncharacterized protein n=2 Tax=Trichinella pseudospiralis TaxID=6337 RepID=A0A0V1J6V2_TRIPS|nr:hypothetical protein T4D_289 [Trichinella pseudospiralis]KRZ30707.1 hypothetical protein T4B_14675 [Trichinella pseudospiralis]
MKKFCKALIGDNALFVVGTDPRSDEAQKVFHIAFVFGYNTVDRNASTRLLNNKYERTAYE